MENEENTVEETGTDTIASDATASSENIVTMTDGKKVNFNKRNKLIKWLSRTPDIIREEIYIDEAAGEIVAPLRINCNNGEFFNADVKAPLGTPEWIMRLARHGQSQKISDAVTKPETDDDLAAGVSRIIAQLSQQIWTQITPGDGSAGLGDLIEACRRAKKIDKYVEVEGVQVLTEEFTKLRTQILGKDKDSLTLLKNNNAIKALIADIKVEREAEKAAKLRKNGSESEKSLDDLLA
jgi:hypothetical protein